MERRLTTILSADVAGYSRLMERDEAGTLAELMERQSAIIDPLIAQGGGRIVKTLGDGFLAEFGSPVNAVTFAVEMQQVPGRILAFLGQQAEGVVAASELVEGGGDIDRSVGGEAEPVAQHRPRTRRR